MVQSFVNDDRERCGNVSAYLILYPVQSAGNLPKVILAFINYAPNVRKKMFMSMHKNCYDPFVEPCEIHIHEYEFRKMFSQIKKAL